MCTFCTVWLVWPILPSAVYFIRFPGNSRHLWMKFFEKRAEFEVGLARPDALPLPGSPKCHCQPPRRLLRTAGRRAAVSRVSAAPCLPRLGVALLLVLLGPGSGGHGHGQRRGRWMDGARSTEQVGPDRLWKGVEDRRRSCFGSAANGAAAAGCCYSSRFWSM